MTNSAPKVKMKPGEQKASQVVKTLLSSEGDEPVQLEQWDTSKRQGAHDFWIYRGDVKEALEITTLAEQSTRTNAGHWQKRGPGYFTTVDGLSSTWMLLVDPRFKADALTKNLDEWLRALENEGITETGLWDGSRMYVHPVTTALASAGVLQASAVSGPPAGSVHLVYQAPFPSRPAGDPNHISTALTEALKDEKHQGDAAKLDRSGVPVRHLFFWVDAMSRLDVARAFDEGVPTAAPDVDERITWVWLALHTETGADVLRWSARSGWLRDEVSIQPVP
ncbi:hypothetical protein QNN03_36685 [Streptomyces sp. GXMU-J15]|uniref:Uncharacterized protein n=1 Tax=Streptomyces fuscus TaxID=3048495 RepID=A0ABT7JDV4_9ACTN|nr:hypothetical protein [Streptomyces fuscus]MDL2081977.1 hypothetical protein [Streptomyces fuscus]